MAENIFPYELPANWHWSTLGNIAKWGSGGTPSRKIPEYYRGNISWIKTGELNDGYIFESEEHITADAIKNSSAKIFPKNSVVIAMYGATIGKVGILGVESSMNQACACAVCNENIYFKFLFYYALSQRENFIRKSKGGAQPNISQEIIKKFPIPLPPLDEQKRIVSVIESLFEKLDEARSIVQKILDGYELRRVAFLHKAFTGDLTKNFRADSGLLIDDWQKKKLGDVCQINPPKISTQNLSDDLDVSFFPMASLSEVEGKITKPQIKKLGEVKRGYTNFSEGDVVFAKITPCMENGKSAVIEKLVNDVGFGTTEFFVLRCSENILNKFLYHLIRGKKFRDEAKEVMAGAVGQLRVPKNFLINYEINLPPLAEQKEIVRVLDGLLEKEQRTKEIAEKILLEIDLLKRTILARAFRGELGTKYQKKFLEGLYGFRNN